MSLDTFPLEVQVVVSLILALLLLIDLVGNGLVIIVIHKYRVTRTPMDYLLMNLAIADIIAAISMAPWFIFLDKDAHPTGTGGKIMCSFLTRGCGVWIGASCSALLLTAIAFERYYSIIVPLKRASKMSRKNIQRIVYFSWGFSVLLNIPLYIGTYYDEGDNYCLNVWPAWLPIAYSLAWAIFIGVIPISCFVALYAKVIHKLWFSSENPETKRTRRAVLRHRKHATKMIITVSVIFILCSVPDRIYYTMLSFGFKGSKLGDMIDVSAMLFTVLNSAVNPLVYTIQNQKFRNQMKSLFCKNEINEMDIDRSATKGSQSYVLPRLTRNTAEL